MSDERKTTSGGVMTKQELIDMIRASRTRIIEALPDYAEGSREYKQGKRGIVELDAILRRIEG